MSVYRKNSTNENKIKNKNDPQKESPLIILKLENNNLNNELKRINNLITKLKAENIKKEQEKILLLTKNKKIDTNLQEIKEQLYEFNNQLIELKNKGNDFKNENEINTQNSGNNKLKLEMQNKITDLELKLKLSEQKIFSPLEEGKNSYFEIIKKDNLNNEKDVITELNKAKIKNQNLIEKLIEQKKDFENISMEKENILNQLKKYNKDKKILEILLGKKEDEICERKYKEDKLKKNINIQTNENMKIKNNINIIQTKCSDLIKEKYDLEDIVIKQEDKINFLNKSINEVKQIIDTKDNQIKKDKIYINNLKEVIRDLKNEFNYKSVKRINKYNPNKEFLKIKIQLNNLKNQEHNIININNINNINNKNYIYNNSINNLMRININKTKKYNNKLNIRFRNKKNNDSFLKRRDSNNDRYFSNNSKRYFEININQKNNSLPNVEHSSKRQDINFYKKGIYKNKLNLDKNTYNNINKEQKLKNDENKNILKPRLLKKHIKMPEKEENEKEKINEVKDLFDKIIFDFDN